MRARDLSAHYTDFGIFPRDALVGYLAHGAFSLHLANGTLWFQALLFLIAGLFAAMLLLGYRTRLATIASWLLLLSLQNRNPMILSGEDNLIMLLTFWGMFLPLGARFSVDAALNRSKTAAPNAYFSVGTLALLVQGMSMYFFSALLKSDAQWIPDGTAVHYALQLDYFATPFALWFRQFPALLQGLTYYVWTLEIVGPILIFSPLFFRQLRPAIQLLFITMHIGFFLCLEIGLFPFISILMNLTFTQGWIWDRLGSWARKRTPEDLKIYYDGGCDFCLKTCRLLVTFLVLPNAKIQAAQSEARTRELLTRENSWIVTHGAGRDFLKWHAVRRLVACSPFFRPLALLLALAPLRWAGDRLYLLIAAKRTALGCLTAWALPYRSQRVAAGPLTNALAAVFLAIVLAQNISTLPAFAQRLPDWFVTLRQALGLYQNWTMFAPHPEMTSPWPVIVGQLADGMIVDVYNHELGRPDWTKPKYVSRTYANYRWRRYLSNLEDMSYDNDLPDFGLNYGRYLCRLWNRDAAPGRQLRSFKIYFNVEWSQPVGQPKQAQRRLVWIHDCFG